FSYTHRCPPSTTLFPYTTLFRSRESGENAARGDPAILLQVDSHRVRSVRHGQLVVGALGLRVGPERPLRRAREPDRARQGEAQRDRKSTRLNSSHVAISYAVFCL